MNLSLATKRSGQYEQLSPGAAHGGALTDSEPPPPSRPTQAPCPEPTVPSRIATLIASLLPSAGVGGSEGFTIYATPKGYLAVTNPVRQRILQALEDGDRTLTDLVELTGKAKSTLSAVHLRDLLASGLAEERPHADDARVKVYRLAGRRIGSSSVPLGDLREAVKNYAASSQGGLALSLASIVDAFDRLPALEPQEMRWVGLVGERLGSLSAMHLKAAEPGPLLKELGEVWRRDGLGTRLKAKADASALELDHASGARPGGPRCAFMAGFLQGALTTRSGRPAWVQERTCSAPRGTGRKCTFSVAWP
jgi:uncharacterized protein